MEDKFVTTTEKGQHWQHRERQGLKDRQCRDIQKGQSRRKQKEKNDKSVKKKYRNKQYWEKDIQKMRQDWKKGQIDRKRAKIDKAS